LGDDWYHLDTQAIFDLIQDGYRVQLPRATRPEFTDIAVDIPLDPYLFGAWLGDGHSSGARITSEDEDVIDRFRAGGYDISADSHQNSGNASTYSICTKDKNRNESTGRFESDNSLHSTLREMEQILRYDGVKHIPEEYFCASYNVRLELIKGLMDTDGCHHSNGSAIFSQSDNQLLWDMYRLLKTMGWRVSEPRLMRGAGEAIVNNMVCACQDAYQIFFTAFDNPFYILRKADKWKKPTRVERITIKAVRNIPIEPMRCLTVDAEDSLFAIGEHWTMTRNTATGITAIMNQSQMRTWETVTRFAEQYVKPLFRKWIAYNQAFLDMNIAVRVVGDDYASVSKDDIKGNFDLKVSVAIGGTSEDKAQKIIQMLQMVQPLVDASVLSPNHITKLIAELEELWEFKELAQELRSQAEQQGGQMQGIPQEGGMPTQVPNGLPIQ